MLFSEPLRIYAPHVDEYPGANTDEAAPHFVDRHRRAMLTA
jgi:hypothetical protein